MRPKKRSKEGLPLLERAGDFQRTGQLGGQDRLSHLLAVLQRQQPDVVALIEANVQEHVTVLAQASGMQFAFGEANNSFHVAWLKCHDPL